MKKLKLTMDDLRVETFTTAAPMAGAGTVQAHYGANHTVEGCVSGEYTCEGWATYPDAQQDCVIC